MANPVALGSDGTATASRRSSEYAGYQPIPWTLRHRECQNLIGLLRQRQFHSLLVENQALVLTEIVDYVESYVFKLRAKGTFAAKPMMAWHN